MAIADIAGAALGAGLPSFGLSSGPSTASGRSGDAGASAFNIGGINLGTQYPTAATAGGANAPGSLAAFAGSNLPLIVGGIVLAGALTWILFRRR